MTRTRSEQIAALTMAFLFTVIAGSVLTTAYTYSKASSLLPRFVGWVFLILAASETLIQLVRLFRDRSTDPDAATEAYLSQQRIRGAKGFLWIAGMLLLLYLAGFLVATPLFIFAFLRLSAGESATRSAIIAAGATLVVWLGFVELLEYKLYSGLLFR